MTIMTNYVCAALHAAQATLKSQATAATGCLLGHPVRLPTQKGLLSQRASGQYSAVCSSAVFSVCAVLCSVLCLSSQLCTAPMRMLPQAQAASGSGCSGCLLQAVLHQAAASGCCCCCCCTARSGAAYSATRRQLHFLEKTGKKSCSPATACEQQPYWPAAVKESQRRFASCCLALRSSAWL